MHRLSIDLSCIAQILKYIVWRLCSQIVKHIMRVTLIVIVIHFNRFYRATPC